MTKTEFLKDVLPVIKRVAEVRGYGKFYKAISAQAACESAYGKSSLASKFYNFFGMKATKTYKGKVVDMKTREEYVQGQLTTITATFRAYDSIEAGINGYFDFIESYKRYSNLKSSASDDQYIERLKADGWATSSTYVNTLKKFKKEIFGNDSTGQNSTPTVSNSSSVSVADDLQRVARDVIAGKYGNGSVRRLKLQQAGYDYNEVQKIVNKILRGA